jgi:SAM-dependent methyltransferase
MPARTFADQTLLPLLDRLLTTTRIRCVLPDGDGEVGRSAPGTASTEPDGIVRVTDTKLFHRMATEGTLGLAESYMDGGWDGVRGTLEGDLSALLACRLRDDVHRSPSVAWRLARLRLRHKFLGTQPNVRAHYDIGDDLYAAFLDETRGYTCGYQRAPADDSRTLQENKYDRVCKKLHLCTGDTLFDIGCGYGGRLVFAAQHYGARCTGITNSLNHAADAASRAQALGIADRLTIHTGDFREARGAYDRVVSLGMFEHLFHREHAELFATFKRLMAPGAFGLLHTLGCVPRPNTSDPLHPKIHLPRLRPESPQRPRRRLRAGIAPHPRRGKCRPSLSPDRRAVARRLPRQPRLARPPPLRRPLPTHVGARPRRLRRRHPPLRWRRLAGRRHQ